jgi:hypothetical protein
VCCWSSFATKSAIDDLLDTAALVELVTHYKRLASMAETIGLVVARPGA